MKERKLKGEDYDLIVRKKLMRRLRAIVTSQYFILLDNKISNHSLMPCSDS